jgi:hypothetical protein
MFGMLILLCVEGCMMKTFYVVEVDGSKKPLFPDSCVACGMPGAERPVNITLTDDGSRVDFYFYKLPLRPAQGPKLEVPVHDSCAKGIRNTFLKQFALAVLASALILGAGIYSKHMGVSLIAVLAVLVVFLYIQAMKRVPVEFHRHGGKYVLMFGDRGYAEKVASLNGAQVRTGTDPYTGD